MAPSCFRSKAPRTYRWAATQRWAARPVSPFASFKHIMSMSQVVARDQSPTAKAAGQHSFDAAKAQVCMGVWGCNSDLALLAWAMHAAPCEQPCA